jgi:hypothetical protein
LEFLYGISKKLHQKLQSPPLSFSLLPSPLYHTYPFSRGGGGERDVRERVVGVGEAESSLPFLLLMNFLGVSGGARA